MNKTPFAEPGTAKLNFAQVEKHLKRILEPRTNKEN